MDLLKALLEQPGPVWSDKLTHYVCADKDRFKILMKLIVQAEGSDYRLNQRATLILLEVEKIYPTWVQAQVPGMTKALHKTLPVAIKRNLLRILQNQDIPESLWGHAADQCFQYLGASDEPIAVKVFSMTVLHNLTKKIPELGRELKYLIEDQYEYGSAGFKARGRKVLAALTKAGH